MDIKFTIFLSGTRRDLPGFHPAAKAALEAEFPDYEIRMMEDAEPEDIPGDHWSRREATTPDLLIGLVGRYYGSIPHGQDRSLTEQEFVVAGKVGIERLMFVTDASDPTVVENQDEVAQERSRTFRGKVDAAVTRGTIASPDEFATEAVNAVRAWERETLHGATQRAEIFFAPLLAGGALFDHTEQLVGQIVPLRQLQAFIASDRRILVLHGPWGRGKSRLLLELSRSSGINLRLARTGAPLLRERLRISAVDPCVLVVEDVWPHEDDLSAFLDFLARCGPEVKLIATTRSTRARHLKGILRESGIPAKDVEVLALPALSDRDQQQLIAQILGADGEIAYRLAVRTRGSALAAVVAARLIRRGFVTLAELELSPDFVGEVLDRFQDALLRSAGENVETANRLKKTLQAVSLCAPVRPGSPSEMEALAAFLDVPPEDVVRDLGQLEDAGLLLRRGGLVTIPVDAIRETEALRACVTPEGELTGFADRALRALGGVYRRNLLRNLALADWRASQEAEGASLLAKVWPDLAAAYDELPISGRLTVLKDLEDVAPYQPGPALAFVRHALANGLGPSEVQPLFTGRFQVTVLQLHDALTDVVRGTLHDSASFAQGCDLLWHMTEEETRPANSHPRSAERVLLELGELRPYRPPGWYEEVLGWMEQKLESREIPGARLAAYLRPFIAKEIVHWWHDDEATHLQTYRLATDRVRPLREKAYGMLERIGQSTDLGAAAAAVQALGKGLEPPAGIGGRPVTEEELAAWEGEEKDTLSRLRRVRGYHRSPAIDLCVLREVAAVAEYAPRAAVRDAAAKLAADLNTSVAGTIERALLPWWSLGLFRDEQAKQKAAAGIEATADHFLQGGFSPHEVVRQIAVAHENLCDVNCESRPEPFLRATTLRSHAFGRALLEAVLRNDDHSLTVHADGVLLGLLEADPEPGKALLELAVRDGGPRLKLAAVSALGQRACRDALGQETALRHLAILLGDADARVQRGAVRVIWLAKELDGRERAKILLIFEPLSMPVIDEWSMAVAPQALYGHFLPEERTELVAKLQRMPTLDFHCAEVLAQLCADVPATVIDMLLARVRACATADEDFEPLADFAHRDYLAQLPAAERELGLIALGDLLEDTHWRVRNEAQQLFAKLAVGDEGARRRVRLAWASSGDRALLLRAAESFRSEPPQAVFTEEETVIAITRAAAAIGPVVLAEVTDELVAASLSGVRVGSPGEPTPVDVFIRDEAQAREHRYPSGSPEAATYGTIARAAEASIASTLRRHAEESLAR